MMISSSTAADPYAAAAALDRQLRSSGNDAGDAAPDSASPDASPDVVVTLGSGSSSPATYNASGKLSGAATLDDMGANAPDSLAKASESVGGDDATAAPVAANDDSANADQDAAAA